MSQSASRALPHGAPLARPENHARQQAPDRAAWLRAIEHDTVIAAMRSDRRRNVLTAARILGWSARGITTRPTRARSAARMGVSERTVSKCWRLLEELGYLRVIENGTTAQFRGARYRDEGNLARTWILTLPESSPCPGGSEVVGRSTPRPGFPQPKKISDEGWRRETARFIRAGWLPADLRAAVEARPEGARHAYDDPPRHPRAWLRWRLSWWLDERGEPLPSPSQRRAAEHVQSIAEQARRRAERRPPAGYEAGASLARQLLTDRLAELGRESVAHVRDIPGHPR